MSLRRDLVKHVKALALQNPDKPHILIMNSDMITFEDAVSVNEAMQSLGFNAMIALVKGDVRKAAAVASLVDGKEIKEVTDVEEVQPNA
jgi:hypothetical protein